METGPVGGSGALFASRTNANPPVLLPEIHFNIWEEGVDTAPSLDIGVMLDVNDPTSTIEIFLPWILKDDNVEDLYSRLSNGIGISVIFNEAWRTSSAANQLGTIVIRDGLPSFTVFPYKPKVSVREFNEGTFYSVVLDVKKLAFSSAGAVANTPHVPNQMYVRFRIKNVPHNFYRVGFNQGDAFGGGALSRTEIIDFRLNIRRGVPVGLESILNGKFIEFSKVQLFLMKSKDQDIVFEDKLFRACRSLEDEGFWADYIQSKGASQKMLDKCLAHVKNSLGYQWRKTPETGHAEVSEFGILARFKSFKMRKRTIFLFVCIALILGAGGNAVYDYMIKPVISKFSPSAEDNVGKVIENNPAVLNSDERSQQNLNNEVKIKEKSFKQNANKGVQK